MNSNKNLVKKFFRKLRISKPTLHEDIKNHVNPKMVRLKMKKRSDINYKDRYLKTPLYYACENDEIEWACMLLCYEADPCILCTDKNLLPIFATRCPILQEILLPYYICHEFKISLVTLGAGLQAPSDIFSKFIENVNGVDVDIDDIDLFINEQVTNAQLLNLELFVEKFTKTAWELCAHCGLLDLLITLLNRPNLSEIELSQLADIFEKLLGSEDIVKLQFYKPDLDIPIDYARLVEFGLIHRMCPS